MIAIVTLEDRDTGDLAGYGPFHSEETLRAALTKVNGWVDATEAPSEIAVNVLYIHRFRKRTIQTDGWI